jgi:hypothetical protein
MAKEKRIPLRLQIRELEPGKSISFPIQRMQTIKTTCYELGTIYCRKFSTKLNRQQEIITVTRIN